MSEQRIRRVLRQVCDELDRRARQVVLASAVGAGVGLASGCEKGEAAGLPPPMDRAAPEDGAPPKRLIPSPIPPYGVVVPPPPVDGGLPADAPADAADPESLKSQPGR